MSIPTAITTLRLGTRGSQLARTQSGHVAKALRQVAGIEVELIHLVTEGDVSTAPLASLGGVGVFANRLRAALRSGEVDFAVHSLKDLPTSAEPDLVIAAIPTREDPRDAVVCRDAKTLAELPPGSTVGTGSPRRAAQVRAMGLGLEPVPVRGNVDTRLNLVHTGQVDAVILAASGLRRIGRESEITELLDPLIMLPAPGQGALAVECRADRPEVIAHLRLLDDPATRAAVIAERALLAGLEGGCAAPIGALAEVVDGETTAELWLRAVLLETDGSGATRLSASRVLIGDEGAQQADPAWSVTAESLGWALADEILAVRAEAQVLEADV